MGHLDLFGELKDRVAVRVGASREQDVERIRDYCLEALRDVWRRHPWAERRDDCVVQTVPNFELTVGVTNGSRLISSAALFDTAAFPSGHALRNLMPGWANAPYEIESVTDASNAVLARDYLGETNAALEASIYQDRILLPQDVAEVLTEDISLLDERGKPLTWMERLTGRWEYAYPRAVGRPDWLAYGKSFKREDGTVQHRTMRVGSRAPDKIYAIRIGYRNEYPGRDDDKAPVLVPESRRDVVVWGALMRAYSEPPWVNEGNALQFKQLYEAELGIARESEKEGDAELFVIERYDEGALY